MAAGKKKDRRTLWIRIICIVLAFLMVGSTLLAILDIF